MYLIPKNIKIKKEIFKGIGIIELIALAISICIGFILQTFAKEFHIKIFCFFLLPLSTFLLILPLPNGTTALKIFKKFLIYQYNQKQYKFK